MAAQVENRAATSAWRPVKAAAMVNVLEEHPVWDEAVEVDFVVAPGSFVRLRPPPTASDVLIEEVRASALAQGAKAVRVVPKARASVLVKSEAQAPDATAREVVLAMVAEANTKDRPALLALAEKTMAKVKL